MSNLQLDISLILARPRIHRGLQLLWWATIVGLVGLNAALLVRHIVLTSEWAKTPFDWTTFEIAVRRIGDGTMYDWIFRGSFEYSYRYTPLFAYAIAPFIPLGIVVWRLLHFAVLSLLPWKVAIIVALSWPFWEDVLNGNVMTFALVFGWLALQGSRLGGVGYFGLTILVPRPLMLPLAVWMVWKRPEWRVPAIVMVFAAIGLTLATGEAFNFLAALGRSDDMLSYARNFGASRWLGVEWLIVGIPLGLLLIWLNHVGWASLAVSPYLLPYHYLIAFLELQRPVGALGGSERDVDRSAAPSAVGRRWLADLRSGGQKRPNEMGADRNVSKS